jgi:hypothetical protein
MDSRLRPYIDYDRKETRHSASVVMCGVENYGTYHVVNSGPRSKEAHNINFRLR